MFLTVWYHQYFGIPCFLASATWIFRSAGEFMIWPLTSLLCQACPDLLTGVISSPEIPLTSFLHQACQLCRFYYNNFSDVKSSPDPFLDVTSLPDLFPDVTSSPDLIFKAWRKCLAKGFYVKNIRSKFF